MNILLITDDFYPNLGGVSDMLTNLCKFFKLHSDRLFVFNPYFKSKNISNILERKEYSLTDLGNFFFKRKNIYYAFYSFLKIFQDKKVPFSHRFKLILYLTLKIKIFMKVLANIKKMYPHLKNLDFDLILGGNSGWILTLNYVLSKIMDKKLITIAHGNDFLIRNPLSLKPYFFKNTDKIIVTNNAMRSVIKNMHHLDEKLLEVINLGVDTKALEVKHSKNDLRKEFDVSEDEFILLSVGRHNIRKNFDMVIKAVGEIIKIKPTLNLKYYLIGEGEETNKLINLTRTLKLGDYIKFLGACDSQMRNKFYKLSDLFIMPSSTKKNYIEGFGIVFLEANYFKIPVIGAATGGMVEAIVDGKTGLLVKPNDLTDLVDKVLLLIDDKEKRIALGENGYKRVLNEFKWDSIVQDYIRVFKEVCKEDN